jgi:Zn finger protein HypA/HybF involved in hydrogenase expression
MHEASLIEDLVKTMRERIQNIEGKGRLTKVYVNLGKESHVSEDILRFWFENFAKETELEGVSLEIFLKDGREITIDSVEIEETR